MDYVVLLPNTVRESGAEPCRRAPTCGTYDRNHKATRFVVASGGVLSEGYTEGNTVARWTRRRGVPAYASHLNHVNQGVPKSVVGVYRIQKPVVGGCLCLDIEASDWGVTVWISKPVKWGVTMFGYESQCLG